MPIAFVNLNYLFCPDQDLNLRPLALQSDNLPLGHPSPPISLPSAATYSDCLRLSFCLLPKFECVILSIIHIMYVRRQLVYVPVVKVGYEELRTPCCNVNQKIHGWRYPSVQNLSPQSQRPPPSDGFHKPSCAFICGDGWGGRPFALKVATHCPQSVNPGAATDLNLTYPVLSTSLTIQLLSLLL